MLLPIASSLLKLTMERVTHVTPLLQELSKHMAEAQIEDEDGNGEISWPEFLTAMKTFSGQNTVTEEEKQAVLATEREMNPEDEVTSLEALGVELRLLKKKELRTKLMLLLFYPLRKLLKVH